MALKRPNKIIAPNNAITREVSRSPHFVSLYANDVEVLTTVWDVRLLLGEITSTPSAQTKALKVNQIAELRLSPQIAKRLVAIISDQLEEYEKEFGTIPQPVSSGNTSGTKAIPS